MSLLSALFDVSIVRRVGLWALIQALPDEDALQVYLRAAYKGFASVIIGSVLTGAAIAAGIVAVYHLMIEAGWQQTNALAATAGATMLLILACFSLAGRWLTQVVNIKDDLALFKENKAPSVKAVVNDAVTNVAEGFLEGLTIDRHAKVQTPARRIRLIN